MLLFIEPWVATSGNARERFNTSHVTLYRDRKHKRKACTPFQYISCYSLSRSSSASTKTSPVSIHLMLLFIWKRHGDKNETRDVSIHLMLLFILTELWLGFLTVSFQYISCYSLSNPEKELVIIVNWFQYISCYSLSCTVFFSFIKHIMFQYISCYSLSPENVCRASEISVSIHLMLLFIHSAQRGKWNHHSFQYISCYSLSH